MGELREDASKVEGCGAWEAERYWKSILVSFRSLLRLSAWESGALQHLSRECRGMWLEGQSVKEVWVWLELGGQAEGERARVECA